MRNPGLLLIVERSRELYIKLKTGIDSLGVIILYWNDIQYIAISYNIS